ncbi:hypothetical protein D3C85_619160 [compost metagenome]
MELNFTVSNLERQELTSCGNSRSFTSARKRCNWSDSPRLGQTKLQTQPVEDKNGMRQQQRFIRHF